MPGNRKVAKTVPDMRGYASTRVFSGSKVVKGKAAASYVARAETAIAAQKGHDRGQDNLPLDPF